MLSTYGPSCLITSAHIWARICVAKGPLMAEVRSIRTPFSASPASTAGATDLTLPCPHLDRFFTTVLPKWPGPGATALEYSRFLEQFIAAKHCIVEDRKSTRLNSSH